MNADGLNHQHDPPRHPNHPNRPRHAFTARQETLERNRRRDNSHRPQIHHPDNEQHRHRTGATADAVKAEAHAIEPR